MSKDNHRMKSALEIALEKTKDIQPQDDPTALSEEAKMKIREINSEYDARTAEIEVRASSKIREMQGKYTEQDLKVYLTELLEQFRAEKDRINAERREKTDQITNDDRAQRPKG